MPLVKFTFLAVTKKKNLGKTNLRKKGLMDAHSMVVEACVQEQKAVSHLISWSESRENRYVDAQKNSMVIIIKLDPEPLRR